MQRIAQVQTSTLYRSRSAWSSLDVFVWCFYQIPHQLLPLTFFLQPRPGYIQEFLWPWKRFLCSKTSIPPLTQIMVVYGILELLYLEEDCCIESFQKLLPSSCSKCFIHAYQNVSKFYASASAAATSLRLNTDGGFWTSMSDSALHQHHQDTTCYILKMLFITPVEAVLISTCFFLLSTCHKNRLTVSVTVDPQFASTARSFWRPSHNIFAGQQTD